MDTIVINSSLDGFVLLDEITEAGTDCIRARKSFSRAPVALGIEALAQLGAMHVRILSEFERHAFLLTIKHCEIASAQLLDGEFRLIGVPAGRGSSAFSYILRAERGDSLCIAGNFLFAAVEYDEVFKRDILQSHYRKVFSCLTNGSRTD